MSEPYTNRELAMLDEIHRLYMAVAEMAPLALQQILHGEWSDGDAPPHYHFWRVVREVDECCDDMLSDALIDDELWKNFHEHREQIYSAMGEERDALDPSPYREDPLDQVRNYMIAERVEKAEKRHNVIMERLEGKKGVTDAKG